MKKWFKNLYKVYLVAFIGILICMIFASRWVSNESLWSQMFGRLTGTNNYDEFNHALSNIVWSITNIIDLFFSIFVKILFIGILIVHSYILWGEKSTSQREFLETLPAKKRDRETVRIIMDFIVVFSTIVIAAAFCYLYIDSTFAGENIHIKWLLGSVCGIAVTTICYMTVLIGFLHIIESLIVRGDMKIIAVLVCLAMIHLIINNLFNMVEYDSSSLIHEIYGFVYLCMVGGCHYEPGDKLYRYSESYWTHEPMEVYVNYNGEKCAIFWDNQIWRMADFANIDSYIWYALSYLLIGVVLLTLSMYIVKRQELSKSGFYFHIGALLLGLMVGITFFTCGIPFAVSVWNSVLIVISSIIVFAVFMYIVEKKLSVFS